MSDQLVTVARFTGPLEAQLALGRLRDEGVQALLTGDNCVSVFTGTGLGGDHQLQVTEADRERAEQILADFARDRELDKHAALADQDAAIWVCPLCGDAVADHLDVCPACQTPRDAPEGAVRKGVTPPATRLRPRRQPSLEEGVERRDRLSAEATSLPEQLEAEGGLDLPEVATFLGDDLARRAFLSALFGFLLWAMYWALNSPLLTILFSLPFTLYAVWLMGRLAFFPGELSPKGMRHLIVAIGVTLLTGLSAGRIFLLFF
jgi:hypothetical protein